MPPITRSSIHGRPSGNTMTASQAEPMDFDSDHEDMADDQSAREETDHVSDHLTESPLLSAHEMLLPLQETANRVSRQVEEFAKCLDQFNSEREVSDQQFWEDAWALLEKYSHLALQRKQHTEASQPTRQLVKNRALAENERQIASLSLEADLWILAKQLLACQSPDARSQARECQNNRLSGLHRYSTDSEIWEAFLDSDEIAQEYEGILDWLQSRAEATAPEIEKVLADSTERSERGDGIWSAGLIYTKDAIKKQKRTRAWPIPLDSSAPGLKDSHVRPADNEILVAQMDPDAPTREDARLALQDEYHEEAAWQTCWELLRRGRNLEEIRGWWTDRKETWRSALLQNASSQRDQRSDSPWLRIINIASNSEWFNRCRQMCDQELGSTDYENAVFGVLSGSHMSSMEVCKDMDDNLFSFFNAKLIERYRDYVAAFRTKLQNPTAIRFQPREAAYTDIYGLFEAAQADDKIKDELHQPHKYIESAVITQRLDDFFILTGRSAAQMATLTGHCSNLIQPDESGTTNDFAKIAAQNQDSVRIITHLQLILRALGFLDEAYKQYEYQLENNIVNYMGYLEKEGKYTLLPLYASKLSPSRITFTLGTILVKITDSRERDLQIKLMKQYGINVPKVLFGIFQLQNYHNIEQLASIDDATQAKRITDCSESGSVRTTKIVSAFIGDQISQDERKAIQSVEWMKYMDVNNWSMAVWSASALYKIFLLTGKLAAARELTQAANLASVSLVATGMNLSIAGTLEEGSDDEDVDMVGSGNFSDHVLPVSPTRKRRDQNRSISSTAKASSSREELADQSRVWAQLEQLTEALSALERWQDYADEIDAVRSNPSQMRQMKKELQHALTDLQSSMLPLLDRDFLMVPNDEAEEKVLMIIRNHYIPECILGYNAALYFAGHSVTRRYLVECMNLAQEVAQNDALTDAFVAAGRMGELVNAFALDSQALLRANEAGGKAPDKPKKGKGDAANVEGKADIWQVSWKEENDTAPVGIA